MSAISSDVCLSPLFCVGLLVSYMTLAVFRQREATAAAVERRMDYSRTERCFRMRTAVRVRVGPRPLLEVLPGGIFCFVSPHYLLARVFWVEPLAILPFAVAWFALLTGDYNIAWISALGGTVWRLLWDSYALRGRRDIGATLFSKILFCWAGGVYCGAMVYLILVLVMGLLAFLAFGAAHKGNGSRYNRRRTW